MPAGDADRIRDYAARLVEEARHDRKTRITIRSGDVHYALELRHAYANVGQSLEGETFQKQAGVRLVDYRGVPSRRGANAYFEFEILPTAGNTKPSSRDELLSRLRYQNLKTTPSSDDQPIKDIDESWRKQVLGLSPSEFQELAREYLKAKGFADAEIEIVIKMKA